MIFDWFRKKRKTVRDDALPRVVEAEPPLAEPTATRDVAPSELTRIGGINRGNAGLAEFALNNKAVHYPAGSLIFRRGEGDRTLCYLLEGTVLLEPLQGRAPEVTASSPVARFPLNAGSRYATSAFAKTDVWLLRVPEWEVHLPSDHRTSLDPVSLVVRTPELQNNHLLFVFAASFNASTLKLPTIPVVISRLREALAVKGDLQEAARIVQAEPVLAGKIIEVVNSPLFRTAQPIASCLQAMTMLGVTTSLNLITGLYLSNLYVARKAAVRSRMQSLWRQSVYVSALASALAAKTSRIPPEQALLAGLLSHIGTLPFLQFLDVSTEDAGSESDVTAALNAVNGPVGYHLLTNWGLPDDIALAPTYVDDWFHDDGKGTLSLADIVILANWHSRLGKPDFLSVPPITSLPAYAKMDQGELGPEMSLAVLSDAKDEVRDLCRLLS